MSSLEQVDLVLTDPPYGINRSGQHLTVTKNPRHSRKAHKDYGWDIERPGEEYFHALLIAGRNQIIWGGNYFADILPPSMGWLVWDKGQDFSTSDCELAWTSYRKALRRFICNRGAIAREGATHPTQKPQEVMARALVFAQDSSPVESILDPYMGSGTTLRVAKDRGIRAIGIDQVEAYCDMAARRLSQEVLAL